MLQKVAAGEIEPRKRRRKRISRTRLLAFIPALRSRDIPDNFEHRVWLACMTDRSLPDPDARFLGWQQQTWVTVQEGYYQFLYHHDDDDDPYDDDYDDDDDGWRQPVPAGEWYHHRDDDYGVKTTFRPSHKQVSDWFIVMGWCARLSKRDFRIIWLRSCGYSYTEICDRMFKKWDTRMPDETARIRYNRAIQQLLDISKKG
jgi:Domain of unknown function (DUF6362)